MSSCSNEGTVFDIKRFALHDGEGIRTTLFTKGCPLNCPWCHNPEGINKEIQLVWFSSLCVGCGECARVCTRDAIRYEDGVVKINQDLCNQCGDCVKVCPTNALRFNG